MINFTKMQAIGNDFIIIDCMKDFPKYSLNVLTQYLCNRHFGIGADGVIYLYNSDICDIKMRIFNSDGTEAEMCGNGIRCLARFVYDKKVINKNEFNVETLAGIKKIQIDNSIIKVNMGKVSFVYKEIPVYIPNEMVQDIEIEYKDKNFKFIPISVGNPHAVCFVDNFDDFNFEEIGKYVENYKFFPNKTNVEFVKIVNNKLIKIKVWERGVGKTLGCGTGAIAAASVAMNKLYTDSEIIVELDGGKIEVKEINGEYYLIGDAEFVYEGIIK